jgi:hypothetical protein
MEESRMKNIRLAFPALLFVVITLTLASTGHAQATRTWVSGVGDDLNPCSRTAPCKTFAGAISKTAANGEIDALDPGSYVYGGVTITKSITLDGKALFSYGSQGVSGININITDKRDAATVRIRGLSLNGLGAGNHGINVIAANKVTVEDCLIDGFVNNGINVGAGVVFVRNTTIRNNGGAGINVATGGQVALADVTLIFNATGLAGASGSISSFAGVVLYGNKSGDPK